MNMKHLIAALYEHGCISLEDNYPLTGSSILLWLYDGLAYTVPVTLILEDKIFLLTELLRLPVTDNMTAFLLAQQQANLLLEHNCLPGRVCMDATADSADNLILMYSLTFPTTIHVDAAAQLIFEAGKAAAMLTMAFEELKSRVLAGKLANQDAFLFPVNQKIRRPDIKH